VPGEGPSRWLGAACKAEELGRHDIEPLGDVFTDALHGASAAGLLAVGAVGLMAMLHAAQVLRQGVATGLARRCLGLGTGGRCGRLGFAAQAIELLAQGRLVLHQRLLKQATLVGVHGLGLGPVGPPLQARELELDLLDLGLAQRDFAVLAHQQRVALGEFHSSLSEGLIALGDDLVALAQLPSLVLHLLLQPGDQRGDFGREALRIRGRKTTHAQHAWHRARAAPRGPSAHALSTDSRLMCGAMLRLA
jgi:hypothetical protein